MTVARPTTDLPMDYRMVDADVEQIGPLWIRRQVFEHSVAVPLLTSATASQVDFSKLAAELVAASVTSDPHVPPAVSYDAWVAAAGLHARLDSSEDAGIIIEALETNAPDAFVRCNEPSKLAPGRQLNYRHLFIPVPELLAFIKLHAAATISSRFRETADAVWPDQDSGVGAGSPSASGSLPNLFSSVSPTARHGSPHAITPTLSPIVGPSASTSLSPASPRVQHSTHSAGSVPVTVRLSPSSSGGSSPPAASSPVHQSVSASNVPALQSSSLPNSLPSSPGMDGLIRKKTPTHLGAMVHTQSAIIASVHHAFQRETKLVVNNLKGLLLIVASAYGLIPDTSSQTDTVSNESGIVMGGGSMAAESGTLSRNHSHNKPRRTHSLGSGSEVMMADDLGKHSTRSLPITRQMFEHLSFLLTTTCDQSGAYRPISWIVPQWREWSNQTSVPLGELVDVLSAAITRVPLERDLEGSTDVAEIRDLDRRTILRGAMPKTNAGVTGYPHAKEIRISNCSESHFYLMSSLGRVSLIACRDCTLFVGACVSASLINCVNVRVHAIARVCRLTNCFDTHVYLCTNRLPQVVGENRGLIFAPYNAAHPKEEVDKYLAAVGVDPSANLWNKFHRPAHRSLSSTDRNDPDLTPAVANVLQPDKFLPFAVPVKHTKAHSDGDSDSGAEQMASNMAEDVGRDPSSRALFDVPLELPEEYAEQLKRKSTEMNSIRADIRAIEKRYASLDTPSPLTPHGQEDEATEAKDVSMTDDPNKGTPDNGVGRNSSMRRGVVQSLVQERFRDWLNHTGRIKQINDLVRLDQGM